MKLHNENCTCWNCPALVLKGMVDFRACGQSVEEFKSKMGLDDDSHIMAECSRRPMDGVFEPTVKISHCNEWKRTAFGYMLKNMRVMILGIDGYLGFTLALHLGSLGFKVSGVDNFARREWTKKAGSVVPIQSMRTRVKVAKETLGIDIKFKKLDILKDKEKLKRFIEEEKPEAIVHYAECPSAPFSMGSVGNALYVQENNVLGTLSLLFGMRNTVPESSLIKLGTMGELGQPLTGRPIFEGLFPGDAVLKWRGQEWSLAGEMSPRDPGSFYHLCYDDTTEVFTKNGWKLFKDLKKTDFVLSLNIKTNEVRYENPKEIFQYDYDGKMYNLKQRKVHLSVTPNHNMLVGNKTRKSGLSWKLKEAKEIEKKSKFYNTGIDNWVGQEIKKFVLPEVKVLETYKKEKHYFKSVNLKNLDMDDWLEFIGWYLTEGSIYKKNITSFMINIAQDNLENLAGIINVSERLGYNPHICRAHGKIKGITIRNSQLGQYLQKFGKSEVKFIPKELKNLSKRQLKILFTSLMLGDGTKYGTEKKPCWTYYTASKQLADDVQELALKLGYSAILRKGKIRSNFSEYCISISTTTKTQVNQVHNNDSWIDYSGKVYCCSVDNETLLVRKDGRPVWCGNSKVHDTYNVMEACKYWHLRSIDVMQGIIYGTDSIGLDRDERLRTRFDIDETFGTVVNRFVAQAILGIPLTLYGTGNQIRGLIALKDAMECMTRLILHPPEPGQYSVVNQISGFYSLKELAETVREVGKRFDLDVKIQRIENPRVESEQHPFNPVCENLREIYGFEPKTKLYDEIFKIFALLTNQESRVIIKRVKKFIIPQTRWSGEHQKSRTLEVIK